MGSGAAIDGFMPKMLIRKGKMPIFLPSIEEKAGKMNFF